MTALQPSKAARTSRRVKDISKNRGEPVPQMLQKFLMERFAVRVSMMPGADHLMLKGGMRFWWDDQMASAARSTTDIDLHTHELMTHEQIEKMFQGACMLDLDDGIHITLGRSTVLEHVHGDHKGLRFRLVGEMDGTRINSQVDIGIGGERPLGLKPLPIRPMLKDQQGGFINGQPWAYVVAEKLHAILEKGMENTRMKDYRDIVVLMGRGVDPEEVRAAVRHTFRVRGMALPRERPVGFSLEFAEAHQIDWERFCDKNNITGLPEDFVEVVGIVHGFTLDLILDDSPLNAVFEDESFGYAIPAPIMKRS